MNQFTVDQETPFVRANQDSVKLVKSKMDDDPSAKDHEECVDLVKIKEEEDPSCSGSGEWVKIEVGETPPEIDHEGSIHLMKEGGQMPPNIAHQESFNSIKVEEEAESPGAEPQHIITFSWSENERTPFVREAQESLEDGIVGSSAGGRGGISSTGSLQRNRRRWNHWKNKRASAEDGQGPCTELKYNIMSQSTGTSTWFKKQVCQKSRASRHSEESTLIIVDSVLKFYSLLIGKKASSTSSERKKQIWQYIANKVNATSSVKRTWEQVRKRYYDVKKSIRLKHMQAKQDAKKTAKPVAVQLTPAEQRVANTMNLSSMRVLEGWDSGDLDGSLDGDIELPLVEEPLQQPEPLITEIVKVEEEEQELHNPDMALPPSYLELDVVGAMDIPIDLQEHHNIHNGPMGDDSVGDDEDDAGVLVATPQDSACDALASPHIISSITPETSANAFITPNTHITRKPKRKRPQPTVSNITVNPTGAAQAALLEHTKLLECTVRQCESVERICSAIEMQHSHEEERERARHNNHRTLCNKVDRLASSIEAVGTSITSAVQQNTQVLQEMAKTNQGLLQVFAQTNLILSKISDTLVRRGTEPSPLPAALRTTVGHSPATPLPPHPQLCTPAPEYTSGSRGSSPLISKRGRKGAGAGNFKKRK